MPKVSVIIATYNRTHFVCKAIDSVLNQTFKDYEIIVVDDGSTDNTKQALKKYADGIYYIYQENKGRAEARNTGIKAVQAEYIAFLDDDDIWLPNKLERQISLLDSSHNIGLVHNFTEVIDEQGHPLKKATEERLRLYRKAMRIGYTYVGMSQLCVMFISSVILRKGCLDMVGFFDSGTVAFEDWDFYLRFALKYRICTIPEVLVKYRLHRGRTNTAEFTVGRINTALKHLVILKACEGIPFRKKVFRNFYVHLASAYYIAKDRDNCQDYTFKILKLTPLTLFSCLGLHLLVSLLPVRLAFIIHRLKDLQSKRLLFYSERIVPEKAQSGFLAVHLKRYDFARQLCKDKVVLDTACGVGYGTCYLAEAAKEVIGVDMSEETIFYAKEHYQRENIRFKVMDVYNLEFYDKYFDVICSFETIEHLDYPDKYLAEVKRVLNDNGIFIASTPHVKRTIHKPKNPYHKIEFSKNDFQNLLDKYFVKVEILGQRRIQSTLHYYLQKIDILHLYSCLPDFIKRKIRHSLGTRPWDEADIGDFVINKKGLKRATELVGICYK